MRLDGVISQATSGLAGITKRLATVSQNVSNANSPDYVRETVQASSLAAGGEGMGVRTGVAVRSVDAALQGNVFAAGGRVADAQVRQDALSAVDAASGAPGDGQDLPSLVGALRDAFSTLSSDPSNQTQQRAVIDKASTLADGVNTLADTVGTTRQNLQDGLLDTVAQANAALARTGQLSLQIIAARGRGESTADLEDQRDSTVRTVVQLTGAKIIPQANGDLLAVSGGTVLPTHATTGPLALASATLSPGVAGPSLTVAGQPANLGGAIGATLDVRDRVLPGIQSDLDGFASALAGGFAAVGLTLFTNSSGAVPAAGVAGSAQSIQVSDAVRATPTMVRDGAAAAGAAGDTTLISRVLSQVLGSGSGTLAGQAASLVANVAQSAASAAAQTTAEQAVQSSLTTKLQAGTSVSVDSELSSMVQLQNSYSANAKVIAAVQTMWTDLLASVQ